MNAHEAAQHLMQLSHSERWTRGKWPAHPLTTADMLKEMRGCLWDDLDLPNGELCVSGRPLFLHCAEVDCVEETEGAVMHGNTGNAVWCASFVLAKYLEQAWPKSKVDGLRVVEIGAGAGAAGLAAAALGAARVTLTDLPYCCKALKQSAASCTAIWAEAGSDPQPGTVEVRALDWFQADSLLPKDEAVGGVSSKAAVEGGTTDDVFSCDLILAAGCFWLNSLLLPCVRTLEALSARSPDAVILVSYQSRCAHYDDELFDALGRSFEAFVVPRSAQHPDFNLDCIHLIALRRRADAPDGLHDPVRACDREEE
jgi:predicted nicotinamide N-methyase